MRRVLDYAYALQCSILREYWWWWWWSLPIANADVCHSFGFFAAVGSKESEGMADVGIRDGEWVVVVVEEQVKVKLSRSLEDKQSDSRTLKPV